MKLHNVKTEPDSDRVDAVFHALAHKMRREVIDFVQKNPGCLSGEIAGQFEISRIGVIKHIRILEAADLLIVEKSGRARLHYFNIMPIQAIYERWSDEYSRFFAGHLNQFKHQVEQSDSEDLEDHHGKTA